MAPTLKFEYIFETIKLRNDGDFRLLFPNIFCLKLSGYKSKIKSFFLTFQVFIWFFFPTLIVSSDLHMISNQLFHLASDVIDSTLNTKREIDNYKEEFRFLRNYFSQSFVLLNSRFDWKEILLNLFPLINCKVFREAISLS